MNDTINRKALFDAMRQLLGRPFRRSEVARLDDAVDDMLEGSNVKPDAPAKPDVRATPQRTSGAGIAALLHHFEGFHRVRSDGLVEAYPDPGTGGEPWTIGWGSTGPDPFNDGRIRKGTVWTQAQANEHFANHLESYERDVRRALGGALSATSQEQFDALVSFHYNTGAIGRATLTRKHKAGDYRGAAREFHRWNKAGGRVMKGLVRRRAAEAEWYLGGSFA